MAILYFDSSALVKRYRKEVVSLWVEASIKSAEHIVISRLGQVEIVAAMVRQARQFAISTTELHLGLDVFERDVTESFDLVELDDAVIEQATQIARKHALRAADAIQLACAMAARPAASGGADYRLVSADDELNAAASLEGLLVDNPNQHP